MFGTTDVPSFMLHSAGAAPADFSDEFWARQSPLYHAARVRTPTLVVTGDSDVRVPPSQSHEFYRALKAAGVETELVIFPREPHGLSEPRHRLAFARQALAWIDEHMQGGS
jgi:dipeptidyl aminopeptidase/acylaminoacyl peptidase